MYLLDTNVLSELRKLGDGRADTNVTAFIAAQDAAALHLSVITLLEMEIGVRRIARRDAVQGQMLRQWLDGRVMPAFAGRILPVDATVALRRAALHVPDPRPERDALIAATALVHGMTVVTRNLADFRTMGVGLVDPWQI